MGSAAPLNIYNDHFGFAERPFTLLPDPEFLFWSRQHRLAFTMLEYGVMTRSPITVITGEVGAGKTTLVQYLLQSITDEVDIGLISNAQGGRGELLQWVLHAFDVPFDPSSSYVQLFQQLQNHLLEVYAQGRRVILIIDEAQNLNAETIEELRMLTNINSNKDELLQLILVGQPEFRDMIRQPELRQFLQRVGASYHLVGMNEETVAGYIEHRLKVAGGSGAEIDSSTYSTIHEATGGIPRLVNQLCDLALVYAFSADQNHVSNDTIRAVIDDGVFLGGMRSEKELSR